MAPPQPATPQSITVPTDAYYQRLWAAHGEKLTPPERLRWAVIERQIRRFAPAGDQQRVLDYGCGSGRFLPLLTAHGAVDAFDVTPSVLAAVRQRYPEARVVAGDGSYPTPLADAAYGIAVSTEVLEHVIEQAAYLADAYRVLRPGGLLVLTTPNGRFEAAYKDAVHRLQPIENWCSAGVLADRVRGAGFELLASGTFGAHEVNMPYRQLALYRFFKKLGRRFALRFWLWGEALESRLAGRLGRGITLYLAARRPERG